jgi:hypothetical protein
MDSRLPRCQCINGLPGSPTAVGRTVRAGENHLVAVEITQPDLPMVRAAVARRWIAVAGHHHLHSHRLSACHRGVEVVNLEPQQDTVSVGCGFRVTDGAMVVVHLPAMQLQDQPVTSDEPLIIGSPMRAPAAEELLIPSTARLHVPDTDERLCAHSTLRTQDVRIHLQAPWGGLKDLHAAWFVLDPPRFRGHGTSERQGAVATHQRGGPEAGCRLRPRLAPGDEIGSLAESPVARVAEWQTLQT